MTDLVYILTYGDNQVRDKLAQVHDGELICTQAQARDGGHHDVQFYGDGALALVYDDAFYGDGQLVQAPCILVRDRLALVCRCQALLHDK